jgi:hypothetical protein
VARASKAAIWLTALGTVSLLGVLAFPAVGGLAAEAGSSVGYPALAAELAGLLLLLGVLGLTIELWVDRRRGSGGAGHAD